MYGKSDANTFNPARLLDELYLRGKDKHVEDPEEYAIKNWIVRVQGFLTIVRRMDSHPIIMRSWQANMNMICFIIHLREINGYVR